jgi:DNA-directed RNA polymerase specialized sigma24 family protein
MPGPPRDKQAAPAFGDADAFADLYDRLAPKLYRVALRLSACPADAEDAVQDTFVALVRYRDRLATARDLEAYVFTALRHAACKRRPRPPAAWPLTLAAAPPRVPDEQNAALVYERTLPRLADRDDWPEAVLTTTWTVGADPQADQQVRQLLRGKRDVLQRLHRAAALPGYYTERPWQSPSFDWLMPQLQHTRSAGHLLCADAILRAGDGDVAGALIDLNTALRMADHLAEEPLLINVLVSVAVQKSTLQVFERVLPLAGADELKGFTLPEYRQADRRLQRAMLMEQAVGLNLFARQVGWDLQAFALEGREGGMVALPTMPYRVFLWRRDVASSQRIWQLQTQAVAMPYPEALGVWDRAEAELVGGLCGIVTRMATPALRGSHTHVAGADAQYALAQAALAARRYQLDHRSDPVSLEELVPEYLAVVPTDPFTQAPVRMKTTSDAIVFYSLGPDLENDNAEPIARRPAGAHPATGDIVLRLPRHTP